MTGRCIKRLPSSGSHSVLTGTVQLREMWPVCPQRKHVGWATVPVDAESQRCSPGSLLATHESSMLKLSEDEWEIYCGRLLA
jgi:hypothetical protein